ncbi:4Fe-4S single cluster protein [Geobacillus sp. C56-T2]|nr:4Fe-4S single cluster protein [Geobacillus sp. C56-T2]
MRDFNENPFIVIWELTRACQLQCLHCRAEAQYHRDPRELTFEEGKKLIDEIYDMDQPMLVFTGGDPLMRPDVYDLAKYAIDKGLRVSMKPSATPNVTKEAIRKAKEVGLARWAFSLDGPNAEIHDHFRGTSGSFALTIRAIQYLHELDIPVQINTVISRKMRRLRISPRVRRLAFTRLRRNGRLFGKRTVLHLYSEGAAKQRSKPPLGQRGRLSPAWLAAPGRSGGFFAAADG